MWRILLFFASSAFALDWIDLPQADYHRIIGSDDKEIDHLNDLIDAYHTLDKMNLETRIHHLMAISTYLKRLKQDNANLLNKLVQNKLDYLKKIVELPTDEEIEAYHTSSLCDPSCKPMVLRNELSYSLKMKEFWGEFWVETADPCHRRLGNIYHHWLTTNPESKSYRSFFLWLETQWLDKHIPIVRYFDDRELEAYRMTELRDTSKEVRHLFIIDLKKELFVVPAKEGIWHSSLSRGRPVLGSGLISIEGGQIKKIAFESGHYLPTIEMGYQSLQLLMEKGYPFAEPFDICYFEDRKKYKISISKKCLFEYNAFICALQDPINRKQISNDEF